MDKEQGFSFLEIIIVIAIIGVITLFTFPSYQNIITRARRSDGQQALMSLANKMELYYALHQNYQGFKLENSPFSEGGWYFLRIRQQTETNYALEAIPRQAQAIQDAACQILTFNSLGVKGSKECWP